MNTHQHAQHKHSDSKGKFEVKIASEPQAIEVGKPTKLSIAITKHGKNVPLDVVHERKMHFLVVDEDLSWFNHTHPEEQADGTYSVLETFPSAGKYLLFVDYKPIGAGADINKQEINLTGEKTLQLAETAVNFVSATDGFTVTLLNGNDFKTNGNQRLQFTVEKDGRKLEEKDMENYLGAPAHIVMIGQVDKNFLHIHPVSKEGFPIYAETHVEKAGIYRLWVQFRIDGVVHTVDFTINITEGEKTAKDDRAIITNIRKNPDSRPKLR
ncbi:MULTISPECIES: hypothetical protein [Olivibacter]|uniref:Uncharacterized protein n=2 Tax=Olivibacter TaxID=376469 RepID=A0ABV6HQM0_9SPHI|nr:MULTISPECIES: hypothetical protein [Olivibacter]MDX3917435.1 hypothetical protein [Pseudosphingobacterium sp.]